ncbi:helix-turn-helix domain-containing protein [Marivita sp.]|uniref:helix-turn-helix domain-containing protein n=1 Tax=Marivita sp. TaxID=2003365 RepID=UPI003A848B1E
MSDANESARSRRKISHHGHRIRHARLMKGYTLRQLADLVECSESMISKLENSRLSPSLAMLHRLADALETTVPDLLILDEEDTDADPVTVFPPERFTKLPNQAEEDESRVVWFDKSCHLTGRAFCKSIFCTWRRVRNSRGFSGTKARNSSSFSTARSM